MIKTNGFSDARRWELLGCEVPEGSYGCKGFKNVSAEALKDLIKEGYLDPDDTQNYSPSTKKFIAYIEEHPNVTAHGYVIAPNRDDCRITIEGLFCEDANITKKDIIDFFNMCADADELTLTESTMKSWWS